MTFRLRILGPPELAASDGAVPPGLGPGKPLAVLCYLACEGRTRRDELAAMLWEDADEGRARNAFRQALHRLRTALGDDVVQADRDQVGLAPDAPLWVDLAAFDEAVAAGRHDEALALWRGDFLAGFDAGEPAFDHWADAQRTRLRGRYQDAVMAAVRAALDAGRTGEAAARAKALRDLAPLDPQAALLEARALAATGQRGEAAAALRSFEDRYRRELELDPPREIVEALAGVATAPEAGAGQGGGAARAGPFVREAELGRLLAAWRQAVSGEGQVVVVTGETGSGKSRLVEELLARIETMDAALLLRGAEAGAGVPYSGVAEALRGILGARGLAGASEHLLAEAARLLPALRDRFDLPHLSAIDDDTARLRFFEGVAAVLDAVAYEQPLCLVLERLEHADRATLDLVFFLASRLRGSPALFVLTARPVGPADVAARFAEVGSGAVHVPLEPLPDAAMLEILSAAPEGRPLAAEERQRIAEHAGGNPLRALELARDVAAGVRLARLPETLAAIYRARVEACDPAERRILLVLALLGRAAPLRLLAAASHLSEPATMDAFTALRSRGLVFDDARGVHVANDDVREQVLEQAGPAGITLLAGWTADALLAQGGNPGELALLLARAGRGAAAFAQAMRAGQGAVVVGAWSAAAGWFELAADQAPDARATAEAQTLLTALGEGRPRLSGPPGARAGDAGKEGDGATGANAAAGNKGTPSASPGTPDGPGPGPEPVPPPAHDGRAVRWTRVVAAAITSSVVLLAILALLPVMRRPGPHATMGTTLRDTLVLLRMEADGRESLLGVVGDLDRLPAPLPTLRPAGPAWSDSLRDPWLGALVSPDRRLVAVTRRRPGGAELLVIPADRGDTLRIAAGLDVAALSWAPDASRLLILRARHLADGRVDRDLYAVPVASPGDAVPIDTSRDRSVVEAAWSPDGTRVAWVARDGAGQQDVYVSFADGTDAWNASANPAQDDHVAWSPDGRRVAFTSDRGGNTDIYAVEVQGRRLWRLTWDAGVDDDASFSPLGDFVAFESTRGTGRAVYVMASYGGEPHRVSPPGRPVRPGEWRGAPPPYLDRLLIDAPPVQPGDTAVMEVQGIYTDNVPRNRGSVRWRVLDPGRIVLRPDLSGVRASVAQRVRVIGVRPGPTRVVVSAGGWRSDTVSVRVGN